MTEHSNSTHQTDQSGDRSLELSHSPSSITLNLPSDLASVVEQYCQQADQPAGEVILTLLRSALKISISQPSESAIDISQPMTAAALEVILERLAKVEALIPRLEALEGKSIAF